MENTCNNSRTEAEIYFNIISCNFESNESLQAHIKKPPVNWGKYLLPFSISGIRLIQQEMIEMVHSKTY